MIVTEQIETTEQIENAINVPTVESKSKDVTELVKTTFFFEMSFTRLGSVRSVPGAEQDITTTANKSLLRVQKKLFVSPEYKKIASVDAQFKRKIKAMRVPGGLKTVYTLPKRRTNNVLAACAEHELKRTALVEKFAVVYPALYTQFKGELGPMFKEEEWIKPEHVKSAFTFDFGFVTYGVPDELKEYDTEAYQAQVKKREDIYKTAAEDINRLRRALFSKLLTNLQTELAPGDTGTKKTFHSVAITKVQKFLAEYDMNNVTNDEELAVLKAKTANLVAGITADNVKSSEDFKSTLFQQISEITESLKPMIQEGDGTRALKIVL